MLEQRVSNAKLLLQTCKRWIGPSGVLTGPNQLCPVRYGCYHWRLNMECINVGTKDNISLIITARGWTRSSDFDCGRWRCCDRCFHCKRHWNRAGAAANARTQRFRVTLIGVLIGFAIFLAENSDHVSLRQTWNAWKSIARAFSEWIQCRLIAKFATSLWKLPRGATQASTLDMRSSLWSLFYAVFVTIESN